MKLIDIIFEARDDEDEDGSAISRLTSFKPLGLRPGMSVDQKRRMFTDQGSDAYKKAVPATTRKLADKFANYVRSKISGNSKATFDAVTYLQDGKARIKVVNNANMEPNMDDLDALAIYLGSNRGFVDSNKGQKPAGYYKRADIDLDRLIGWEEDDFPVTNAEIQGTDPNRSYYGAPPAPSSDPLDAQPTDKPITKAQPEPAKRIRRIPAEEVRREKIAAIRRERELFRSHETVRHDLNKQLAVDPTKQKDAAKAFIKSREDQDKERRAKSDKKGW